MRVHCLPALIMIAMLLSCSGANAPATEAPTGQPTAGLPDISGLDALHTGSDVSAPDILNPLVSNHTETSGETLAFNSTADDPAYAIYAVDANLGVLSYASLDSTAPLWLLAADYDREMWVHSHTPSETVNIVNLALGGVNYTSGDDLAYLAVVCAPGEGAELTNLEVIYSPGGFELTVDDGVADRLIVSWLDTGDYDYFEVYRTSVQPDLAPYLIATVDSTDPGEIFFNDIVPTDGGEWVCLDNDNGTSGDLTDDFPSLAPGVEYHYQVVPYYSAGNPGGASAWGSGKLDWGARRTTRRTLPSTRSDIAVFADQLLPNSMTAAQTEWCATHLVGTQKIFQWQADEFRQYNDDFMVVGYHLANGAGGIGNVHGDDWDTDADWPYVDSHEDWFHHLDGSTRPNERVFQLDWDWYVMDPASQWQDYLAANLLQMLGEDHYDGWFIDSANQPWNTDPAQWWPSGETMFGFWTPRLNQTLEAMCQLADAHPLQPLVIPNAGQYVTTVSDIKYYGDTWACDGIMIEGHAHWSPGSYFAEADWVLQHDQILDHQAQGLATILQTGIDISNTQDRLFVFGSYLLVRGDNTYINWLGQGEDSQVGQWYPEFDLDEDDFPWGMPTGANPATMADLWQADPGVYRRSYSSGYVVVNPGDTAVTYNIPWPVMILTVSGGGNITEAGETTGSYSWDAFNGDYVMPAHSALIVLDVFG